ncbi:MAG: class I SAM-dependent methyltransferase [Bacteroidales bacterium]|jgi:ubiquinone/menaquinone biosynthesis C-methylase UbiE|nr:class I SAM-dependent methyltransferase [Bacteroidales bacterium]
MDSKNYFDRVSSNWDKMRPEFFSDNLRDKTYSIVKIEKGKVAADIGAGSGFITEGLIERGIKVIAIDQSEKMLSQIKNKTSNLDLLDLRIGKSNSLPISDNEIDYVFANMYLHHVENPILAIKEMVRILKPAGKLIITDLDCHNYEFLRTEQQDVWLGFDREDINRWYKEARLINIKIESIGENCCSGSETCEENASVSIFFAYGEK